MSRFADRHAAGKLLAQRVVRHAPNAPLVLALPRGGVPVGFEVATALGAPLDVWVVRKLGVPWHSELGMGAVAEGGFVYIAPEIVREADVSDAELQGSIAEKQREVAARVRLFRGKSPPPRLRDRTLIVVDDGIATGGTVAAALGALRREAPKKVVLAVPVAPCSTLEWLGESADEVVCLSAVRSLGSVGNWYEWFPQVDDAEVLALLERARRNQAARAQAEAP